MEKRTEYLFYIGIQAGNEGEKVMQETVLKTILQFPGGQLVVYGCFVPKALIKPTEQGFRWQRNRRKKKQTNKLFTIISKTEKLLENELDGARIRYVYAVEEVANRLPKESRFWQEYDIEELAGRLSEVYLYQNKKNYKDSIFDFSLPKECGEMAVMRLITIAEPYLQRINYALFVGEKDAGAEMLEDYLYEEYGIIMTYGKYPVSNTVWIDLGDAENRKLSKYAKENGICHINRTEVLKFLDTAAKNGYNTKVN